MGIFGRFSEIMVAKINTLLDRAEDPDVMLNRVIRELEDSLVHLRRHTAVAIAAESRLRHDRDENRAQGERWQARAYAALAAGREDLACQALTRKQELNALAPSMGEELEKTSQAVQAARTALHALGARLAQARHARHALIARHRAAQARVEVCRHLGGGAPIGASLVHFDVLADRLRRRTLELAAEAQLCDVADGQAEFADLERQQAIAKQLEAMKRERQGNLLDPHAT